jgi:formate-dependent nitrite reductase cytochrome c552 subunit
LNHLPIAVAIAAPLVGLAAILAMYYWFAPAFTDIGYQPDQPVPFSHRLHAGELGMDCRYCHNTVERAALAAIPPAATCMNCHATVKTASEKLAPVRKSFETGEPIRWVRVHMLPDYTYFDHSVHVANGVGCVECHGRIDQMEKVTQIKPLGMSWCIECHRRPDSRLRPRSEVTNMGWHDESYDPAADPHRTRMPDPPEHCSGCHR